MTLTLQKTLSKAAIALLTCQSLIYDSETPLLRATSCPRLQDTFLVFLLLRQVISSYIGSRNSVLVDGVECREEGYLGNIESTVFS